VVSGYHGQIDSVAILPSLAGFLVWSRPGARRGVQRAVLAGLLIGLGAAIKIAPAVVVLALLPSAEGWRARAALLASAIVVPALALAPFAIADSHGVGRLLAYHGGPGAGGLSLAVQPDLAHFWISSYWQHPPTPLIPSATSRFLIHHGALLTELGLLVLGAISLWRRLGPLSAALLLWLGFYSFGTGFFFQYLVWGLPFFLLAGRLREVAALQLAVLAGMLLFYFGPHGRAAAEVAFAVVMLLVWAALVVAFVRVLGSSIRSAPRAAARPQTRTEPRAAR